MLALGSALELADVARLSPAVKNSIPTLVRQLESNVVGRCRYGYGGVAYKNNRPM